MCLFLRENEISIEEFDKTKLVEKELVDKISLWMLRIIINLGGDKNFLDKNKYFEDYIAYFLDLGKYVDMDREDFKRSEPIDILKRDLQKLEKRKKFTSSEILTKNMEQISKLIDLSIYEEQILEFLILLNQYSILDDTADLLGRNW